MKKKIMFITTVAVIIALAIAGNAFAGNGNESGETLEKTDGIGYGRSAERETGQRFAVQADQYETEEEFHAAVLAQKLTIIDAKVLDGSLAPEAAETIRTHLTECDGTCETEGENPNKPEDGWGIFGNSGQDGQGFMGSGNKGTGTRAADCDEDGEPILDGSGSENGQGYRGGNNN